MKLIDYSKNFYSQFGEDGIIEHIFDVIGITTKICLEVGAGDGLDCSNVAHLWKHRAWEAYLIEADESTFSKLSGNIHPEANCQLFHQKIGLVTLREIVGDVQLDFMSLDIDGNEIHIWQALDWVRPRVMCIEYNPTVPPHISLYQEYTSEDMGFGSSLLALILAGASLGYTFIGATYCNAFFILKDLAGPFMSYDMSTDFDPTYLVSDFKGNALAVGNELPWGIRTPYTGPNVVGETLPIKSNSSLDSYEERYGYAIHWTQTGWPNIADPDESIPTGRGHNARALLTFLMGSNLSPICIDIMHVSSVKSFDWIRPLAEEQQYQFRIGGDMLGLVRK